MVSWLVALGGVLQERLEVSNYQISSSQGASVLELSPSGFVTAHFLVKYLGCFPSEFELFPCVFLPKLDGLHHKHEAPTKEIP